MTEKHERSLMIRYRQDRDQDAFRQLLERHRQTLWAFILSKGIPTDVAETVFQETVFAVARYLVRETPEILAALIFKIARRKIADYYRDRQPETGSLEALVDKQQEPAEHSNPSEQIENRQLSHKLLYESGINPEQRNTLLLHYWVGLTIADIAVALNASKDTVKSRLFHAKKKIRTYLTRQKVII